MWMPSFVSTLGLGFRVRVGNWGLGLGRCANRPGVRVRVRVKDRVDAVVRLRVRRAHGQVGALREQT